MCEVNSNIYTILCLSIYLIVPERLSASFFVKFLAMFFYRDFLRSLHISQLSQLSHSVNRSNKCWHLKWMEIWNIEDVSNRLKEFVSLCSILMDQKDLYQIVTAKKNLPDCHGSVRSLPSCHGSERSFPDCNGSVRSLPVCYGSEWSLSDCHGSE
jgi:hypothetical protein